MPKLTFEISMSLDGNVAGPNQGREDLRGEGRMRPHDWAIALASWRQSHGLEGGEQGPDSELVEESLARTGAP